MSSNGAVAANVGHGRHSPLIRIAGPEHLRARDPAQRLDDDRRIPASPSFQRC